MRVFALFPLAWTSSFGRLLGRLLRWLPLELVATSRRNLELCFPDRSPAERELLLRDHLESLGVALFETAFAWWASNERIGAQATVEGLEHLAAAQAKGRGVILLSAHFTTLEIGARILANVTPLNVMYRPTKDQFFGAFIRHNRAKHARRAIPRDDIRTLITALRNNEVVWYAPDQCYRKKGAVMVRLFGIPAATNTATSRLAAMTGSAVLPCFPERIPGTHQYKVVIHPPLEAFPSNCPTTDAERFHGMIEAHARKFPEQYLWAHSRFKGLSADYPDYYGRRAAAALKIQG